MRITNKDLRIGNLVLYHGKAYKVSDILSSDRINFFGYELPVSTFNVEGFLMNESILIKLGAKRITKDGLVRYRLEIVDFLSIYFIVSEGKITNSYLFVTQDAEIAARFNISIKNEQSDALIISPISFIHELQNLFFIFKRDEINIDILYNFK